MASDRSERLRRRIKETRTALSALLERRAEGIKSKGGSSSLEFSMGTNGPFMVQYLYLLGKLAALYLALAWPFH